MYIGLYSVGEEVYFNDVSEFFLFTRFRGMSENMEEPKNSILCFSKAPLWLAQ